PEELGSSAWLVPSLVCWCSRAAAPRAAHGRGWDVPHAALVGAALNGGSPASAGSLAYGGLLTQRFRSLQGGQALLQIPLRSDLHADLQPGSGRPQTNRRGDRLLEECQERLDELASGRGQHGAGPVQEAPPPVLTPP